MSRRFHYSSPEQMEMFLSGAYRRILRTAIVLSIVATIAATVFAGWRSGLGLASGSLLAYLNFVWLHYGSELMVKRALSPDESGASKFKLMLAFVGRYIFVIAIAYVILKSYPSMLISFTVGLAVPIIAAMCEGMYEAVVTSDTDETPK